MDVRTYLKAVAIVEEKKRQEREKRLNRIAGAVVCCGIVALWFAGWMLG